jgi:hypothetical protein
MVAANRVVATGAANTASFAHGPFGAQDGETTVAPPAVKVRSDCGSTIPEPAEASRRRMGADA